MVERMRKDIRLSWYKLRIGGNLSAFKVAYMSNDLALARRSRPNSSLFINENLRTRRTSSKQTTHSLPTIARKLAAVSLNRKRR